MTNRGRSRIRGGSRLLGLVAVIVLATSGPAAAATQDISSPGPVDHIYLGDDLRCQAHYVGDQADSFFGGVPGSCGTRLRVNGSDSFLTPANQSGVTGSGTQSDPFKVVTTVAVDGEALAITRTDSYVVGDDFYRSDVTVANSAGADQAALLWHWADCFLQDSDQGYGAFDPATGGIYCSANPHNAPPARIEGFVPLSGGAQWFEGSYGEASSPPPGGFPNTCMCDVLLDNGMGLSWNIVVPANGSTTRSFLTTFSPTGAVFGDPPPDTTINSGPSGTTADSTATFAFSASEPANFECSVDGGAFAACGSPHTTGALPDGQHTFAVRAIDFTGNVDPTPATHTWTIRPAELSDLDNPTYGVDVNVDQVAGVVKVAVPTAAARAAGSGRASQKGLTFVPLSEARQVPVGSFLDTRKGTVRLESAANSAGKRQRGTFLNSLFQIRQSRKRSARGLTDLILKGSSFRRCRSGKGAGNAVASLTRAQIRRLRANANGRFRTRGRNSSATVRGTIWDTIDRCDGTLTKVKRGKVVVRDFRRKKNITLTAGKSYLAKAPG